MPRKENKIYVTIIPRSYKPKLKEGDRYSNLVAIKYLEHRKIGNSINSFWLFKCDCGNYCSYKDINFRRKIVSSCNKNCKLKRKFENDAFERLYRTYKNKAKYRNLSFTLTKEEFKNITINNCFYCNVSPSNICKERLTSYKYSGIDRIDNTKGYHLNNCKPCCKQCNIAKNNMNIKDFKQWILRLLNNIKLNEIKQ